MHIYTKSFSLSTVQSSNNMFALKKSFDRTWSIVQKVSYTISYKLVIGSHTPPPPPPFFLINFLLLLFLWTKSLTHVRVIIDPPYLNMLLMTWGIPRHVRAIDIVTQHFYEVHNSNLAIPELTSVTNKINKLFILLTTNMLYVVELCPL